MQLPLHLLFIDAANPRSRRDPAFVKSLAASIAAEGLIEPLHVKGPYADGRFGVVNGGSRLEALQSLHPGEDPAIECQKVADDIAADPARLKSAALAPNVMRAALHPVDAFEAFAALQKAGFTEAHIAERYSVDATIVRQRLRLANLRLYPLATSKPESGRIFRTATYEPVANDARDDGGSQANWVDCGDAILPRHRGWG